MLRDEGGRAVGVLSGADVGLHDGLENKGWKVAIET